MPLGFYITDKGRELIDRAIPTENKVVITKACFGSGGSSEQEVDYSITELKNQFYEKELDPSTDSYGVDPNDPTAIYIKSIVPTEVTGTINEVGYKDADDNLIIYGVVRERTKLGGTQGEGEIFQYQNWIRLEPGDVEKIEINILSPEYEKFIEALDKKVDKEEGKTLISNADLLQITENKEGVKKNAEDILTIKAQIADGIGMPLSFLVKGSENFEGHEITATSKLDKSEFKKKITDGQCVIRVRLPGEYIITNDYNDTAITASVGDPLVDEVYFTDFYASINVTLPEMYVGETIEAKNGEHTIEHLIESTIEILSVNYKGTWEVGIKGTEYVNKASVDLQEKGESKSCTLTTEGVPYITVTVAEELQDERIKCTKDDFERIKDVKNGQVQFFTPIFGHYDITLEQSDKIKETVDVSAQQEYTCTLDLEDLTVPVLIVRSKEEDNGKTIKVSKDITEIERVLKNRTALFVLPETGEWTVKCDQYPDTTRKVNAIENQVYSCVYRYDIFGIKVQQAESDPKNRVLVDINGDLNGLRPITVNKQDGTVDYGDMPNSFLFKAMNNPVLLSIDGTEEIELDPYDYSKLKTGGEAPSATINDNYNLMNRIDKLYTYEYDQDGYEYYFISDAKLNDNYTAIGFTREDDSDADSFYVGCYLTTFDEQGKARSISNTHPKNLTTFQQYKLAAEKTGENYHLEQQQILTFYLNAYLMMVRNFNSQNAVGNGREIELDRDNNNSIKDFTGVLNDKGPVAMDPSRGTVKFMHVEDFWTTNCYEILEGLVIDSDGTYARMKPPYVSDKSAGTSTYTKITNAVILSNRKYVSKSTVNNKWGRFPAAVNGAANTYECNMVDNNTNYLMGTQFGLNGLFFLSGCAFDYSYTQLFARLTYLPPKK